jgi:hypothetical protein
MSFASDVAQWTAKVKARDQAVFAGFADACKTSIVDGSPVTGAPGQPEASGDLKDSWTLEYPSPTLAVISTPLIYAPLIEDGMGPHGPLKGPVGGQGGYHSLKLTIAGAQRLLEQVLQGLPA